MTIATESVSPPDSKLAHEITELVRDTETPLLFNHSSRVYHFGALAGKRRGLTFDPELLYAGAMFHDMGLTTKYARRENRFEVDSANAARDFLRSHGMAPQDVDVVWTAIALHTTPGVPPHMQPVIALVTAGVEMDVMGLGFTTYSEDERRMVTEAYPRAAHFKEDIIQAFYDGMKFRPQTTFGTMNDDVIADKDPRFKREDFCAIIRGSPWPS
jgi:HD superfamily phosphodiesterase